MLPFDNSIAGLMFNIIPIIVLIGFIFVFSRIALNAVKSVQTWKYNNAQPVLDVAAKVVAKRTDVSSHSHVNHANGQLPNHHSHTYTTYYVTFEVESGDRVEFRVQDSEYGLLVEGDYGKLTFQGSRYLGFQRN